jgi:hypothetical protein
MKPKSGRVLGRGSRPAAGEVAPFPTQAKPMEVPWDNHHHHRHVSSPLRRDLTNDYGKYTLIDDDHVPAEEGFASRRRMLLRAEVLRAFQGGDECAWGVSRLSLPFMAARSSGNDRRGWYWGIPVV